MVYHGSPEFDEDYLFVERAITINNRVLSRLDAMVHHPCRLSACRAKASAWRL